VARLAERHAIADLEINRDEFAGLITTARPNGNDLAL
jgi:hypothetical protein